MKDLIRKIDEIEEEVATSWTANDGGLTMAASDILAQCQIARKFCTNGDRTGLVQWCGGWEGQYNCSSGLESDLVSACMEWADTAL